MCISARNLEPFSARTLSIGEAAGHHQPGLQRVDAPHHVDVDVDVVAVLGLEGDVVGDAAVALAGIGVHHQVLLGDGELGPGVEHRHDQVEAAGRVDLLRAARLDEAEQVGAHAHLGGAEGVAGGEREEREEGREAPQGAGDHLATSAARGAAWPGESPISAQAFRTKATYCSGVITAPWMESNILAVSSPTT